MTVIRILPIVFLAACANAFAIDHAGSSPAAHMELKDSSETIVCFVYDTEPTTAPIASGCPEGTYTEQLFDESWLQIGERSVIVGGDIPPVARNPTRIERTCVWTQADMIDAFRSVLDAMAAISLDAFCSITCPEGVAIDAEATASIPDAEGTEANIFAGVSYTQGTGQQTIDIFVRSNYPSRVASDFSPGAFYSDFVIEAAAVCL